MSLAQPSRSRGVAGSRGRGTALRGPFAIGLLVVLSGLLAAADLDLVEVHWAVPPLDNGGRFGLCAVRVQNNLDRPVGPALTLHADDGLGGGMVYQAAWECAGGSSRWAVFAPWCDGTPLNLGVAGGPGIDRLDQPKPSATTVLYLSGSYERPTGETSFPADLLPATVGALDGWSELRLRHEPAWTPAQRQTVSDWALSGGRMLRLPDATGVRPVLAFLPPTRPIATAAPVKAATVAKAAHDADALSPWPASAAITTIDPSEWRDVDTVLGRWLGSPLRRQVPWGGVLSGLLIYALVLGPGLRLLARRRHWLVVHGVLLGVIAITTTIVAVMATQGFGAPPRAMQVVIATAAGPERWVLDRWLTVLEPAGGEVRWQVPGDGVWMGHADDVGLPLISTAGQQASLGGRVPPWGRRLLRQRGGATGASIKVQQHGSAYRLIGEPSGIHDVWTWDGAALTPMERPGPDDWVASSGLDAEQAGQNAIKTLLRLRFDSNSDAVSVLENTKYLLLARSVGLPNTGWPADPRHLLLIWADLPEAWQLADGRDQPGRVLWVIPVPPPSPSSP